MSNDTIPVITRPEPQAPRRHLWRAPVAAVAILTVGILIGHATGGTTSTKVVHRTVIQHDVRNVPGPTITKTVPAPPPPAGTTLGTWSGTGNQVTPAFNPPSSGDYIVKWTYSGNTDSMTGQGSNFIINDNDPNATGLGLPDAIGASGSGSTEVTGATGSSESFNVQATGSWTITVISAS